MRFAILCVVLLCVSVASATTVLRGDSIYCYALSAADTRLGHGKHAVVCVNTQTGDARGALLSRKGIVLCEIASQIDFQRIFIGSPMNVAPRGGSGGPLRAVAVLPYLAAVTTVGFVVGDSDQIQSDVAPKRDGSSTAVEYVVSQHTGRPIGSTRSFTGSV